MVDKLEALRPNIGAETDEPSLGELVLYYYRRHYYEIGEAFNLRDRYFAALRTPANGEQVERVAEELCAGRDGSQPGPMAAYRQGVRDMAARLATPTTDARERVKVLEDALVEAGRMQFAAASIPEGYIDGWADCVEHIRNACVRTALGNKETDRHG